MSLSRRQFLVATSATTTAVAHAGISKTLAQITNKSAKKAMPDSLQTWASVRRLFNLDPEYIHLGLFFLVSHPKPVREAITAYRDKLDANPLLAVDQGMFDSSHPEANLAQRACNAIGQYTGVSGQDIALCGNTTSGLGIIYHGLPLRVGDEVLTTVHDHFSHHEAIRLATARAGATYRKFALFDSTATLSTSQIVANVKKAIHPSTRVLGITWVHSSTGVKLPVRAIADAVAEINRDRDRNRRVTLVVDGVHGLGVENPNILALGCDAFAAGTHKWVLGPRGTGFVWAKPELWATMQPLFPSFTAEDLFQAWSEGTVAQGPARARWFTPGGFHAYEHYWATPAATELHKTIGPSRVTARIHSLNAQMKEGLAKMPHVTLYTPRHPDYSAGIVTFDVKGYKPSAVVARLLEKKIVASTTPYRVSYARVACGLQNTETDVEKTLRAIHSLR